MSTTTIVQLFGTVQDAFAAATQELMVMLVFFFSLLLWKHIGKRTKSAQAQKFKGKASPQIVPLKKLAAEHAPSPVDGKVMQASPATQAAETQMLKLLEQREFTRALNFFRTFERDGRDRCFSDALYSSFIQSAIRVGKIDVVDRLLRSMRRRGTEPTREFWWTTLKMLSSRKHYETCLAIHSIFGRSLPADKVIFSCLINSALESGNPERAVAMLERYKEAGIEPRDNILLFRTFVATGDVNAAEASFRELGEHMTPLMLNLLLLTCVNAKLPDRAHQLIQEAHVFEKKRIANARKPPDEGSSDRDHIVDVVSYNTVIKGFAKAGMLTRCFDCLGELKDKGLEPDDVTFGTMLDTCIADNDLGAANKVVDLLVNGDRPIDRVMCTLFIKGLVRAHRLPKALELYEEMKRRSQEGAKPDIVTYSVLIKACVDVHDLEKALLLVEDMTASGHQPDDIILTHLLEGCRYVGNHALGNRLFNDMINAGVKVSEYTLITMVKLHGRCGAHEEAYELVANWEKQHGSKPSVIHYTCLMSGCLRTKNYDQAWRAYQLMITHGVTPDETTLATLVPGMVASQQWQHVLALVKRALKGAPPIHIAAETLNNALTQMRLVPGGGLMAENMQAMMREAGVPLTSRNQRRP